MLTLTIARLTGRARRWRPAGDKRLNSTAARKVDLSIINPVSNLGNVDNIRCRTEKGKRYMNFEMSGKGVVCNVYYIEKEKLDQISRLVKETGPSLKDLLIQHSDYIVNVSRGFFSDFSQSKFKCVCQVEKRLIKVY